MVINFFGVLFQERASYRKKEDGMTTQRKEISGLLFSSGLDQWCLDRLGMDTTVCTEQRKARTGIREVLS